MTNPDTTSVFIKLKHIFLTLTHDTTTIQLLFLLNLNSYPSSEPAVL